MLYRKDVGRPLTKEEVDANFKQLSDGIASLQETLSLLDGLDVAQLDQMYLDFNEMKDEFANINETLLADKLSVVYASYTAQMVTLQNSIDTDVAEIATAKATALSEIENAKTQALAELQAFVTANTGGN
ncbi:MAG: hypothetical protein EOL93_00690 [Epsilonproteobacteria bacterium]|nr:hypothetical protein [Campylobacterota bacterium]